MNVLLTAMLLIFICVDVECFKRLNERLQAGLWNEESLQLTTRILELCEGHYTVWQQRRKIIHNMASNELYWKELLFIRQYIVETPKNYQIWYE